MTSQLEEACTTLADAARSATAASEAFCRVWYRIGPDDSIAEAHERHIQQQVEMMVGHPVQRMN